MWMMMPWALVAVLLFSAGCGTAKLGDGDLCSAVFEPYPDLVTGRVIAKQHLSFLHGMEAYAKGDYAQAVDSLNGYLRYAAANKTAHLYLANSYLALGKPFEAELQLDHLDNSNLSDFKDQTEWYTVVCWVCSGQLDRALVGARKIVQGRRHNYKREAEQLIAALEKAGVS